MTAGLTGVSIPASCLIQVNLNFRLSFQSVKGATWSGFYCDLAFILLAGFIIYFGSFTN